MNPPRINGLCYQWHFPEEATGPCYKSVMEKDTTFAASHWLSMQKGNFLWATIPRWLESHWRSLTMSLTSWCLLFAVCNCLIRHLQHGPVASSKMLALKTYVMSIRWVLDYYWCHQSIFKAIAQYFSGNNQDNTAWTSKRHSWHHVGLYLNWGKKKLGQAVDEFPKQLKVYAEASGRHSYT